MSKTNLLDVEFMVVLMTFGGIKIIIKDCSRMVVDVAQFNFNIITLYTRGVDVVWWKKY